MDKSVCFLQQLPSEILWELSRFLDLASLILLSTATSRTLRSSFGQFDRWSLYLEPSYRLSLAEWRDAARNLERLGMTDSGPVVVKDGSEKLDQTCHILSKDDSLVDLHLFQDVLVYLHGQQHRNESRLRSLNLMGWHGIAGSFLVNQLRTQTALHGVRTIVKTERADSRIWQQVAIDGQRKKLHPYQQISLMRKAREEAAAITTTAHIPQWHSELSDVGKPFTFESCSKTQAIVQVGRRRPRLPGQPYLKGEGLQIGYESYCLKMAGETPSTLHIILQGREAPDSEASSETTNMLERSIITCNQCKERIVF